jgi:predicted DCC family thiol-disulfide oxidoreductase YuxK
MNEIPENLILFDGVCNLCSASVRFVIRHDQRAIFRFASLQSELGKEICRRRGIDPEDVQTFLVNVDGKILVRSDAAIAVASRFGGVWRIAALLRLVPRVARDSIYSMIARNRYRWFGRTDLCMIPEPKIKERFLE